MELLLAVAVTAFFAFFGVYVWLKADKWSESMFGMTSPRLIRFYVLLVSVSGVAIGLLSIFDYLKD